MRMLILAAAAALSLPAAAIAGEPESFSHDGHSYEYVTTQKGNARIIEGRRDDGTSFRFVVRGNRVRGTLGTQQVSFGLDEVEPVVTGTTAKLAAR